MNLAEYNWPEVTDVDMAFPTFNTPKDLLQEAESRDLTKGRRKFNQLFFEGGKLKFKKNVKGTWKENAFKYCKALMASWAPKHEHKEAVCAMIFEECLKL
jgi:hypothetical protein